MKFFVSACALLCALSVTSAWSQNAPNGQFGVGLTLGSSYSGAQFTYAVNPNIHVGARLGFASISQGGVSQSQFGFGPFFRYLFTSSGVTPYLHAEFAYASTSTAGQSATSSALLLGGGVAYYWNGTFGVRGEINLLDLGLDPSYTQFAIVPARVGVDWFFGR